MSKFVIAVIVVAAFLVGGLMTLLRTRRQSLPPPEVLERVRQRNRELEERERREND